MQITHPLSLPSDAIEQSSFSVVTNNPSPIGTAFIFGDVLFFGFSKFLVDVDITVDLFDNQGNGFLASDTIAVPAGASDAFVQFTRFPARKDGSAMDSCNQRITLVNDSSNQGTDVNVAIFRTAGVGVGLPAPPIDSITTFAVDVMYPGIFAQVKSELPNSVSQVQSDAALGASLDIAIAQATANASGVPGPFGFLPDIRDTQSPIQRRTVAKFKEFEPHVLARGAGKFPDATPAGVASLSGVLSQGMALRLAMQELGEDVSKLILAEL